MDGAEDALKLGALNVDHTLAGLQELRDGLTKTDTDADAPDLSGNSLAAETGATLDFINARMAEGLELSDPFFEDFEVIIDAFNGVGSSLDAAVNTASEIKNFLDDFTNPFESLVDFFQHYVNLPDIDIDLAFGDLFDTLGVPDLSAQFEGFLDASLPDLLNIEFGVLEIGQLFDLEVGCAAADTLNVLRFGLDKEDGTLTVTPYSPGEFGVDGAVADDLEDGVDVEDRSLADCFVFPDLVGPELCDLFDLPAFRLTIDGRVFHVGLRNTDDLATFLGRDEAPDEYIFGGLGDDVLIGGAGNDIINASLNVTVFDDNTQSDFVLNPFPVDDLEDIGPLGGDVDVVAFLEDITSYRVDFDNSAENLVEIDQGEGLAQAPIQITTRAQDGTDLGSDTIGNTEWLLFNDDLGDSALNFIAISDVPKFIYAGDGSFEGGLAVAEGTDGEDILIGRNNAGDILRGRAGDDRLFGGSGNDILDGGAGSDLLVGGEGDDTFLISLFGGDTVDPAEVADGDRDYIFGNEDEDFITARDGAFVIDFIAGTISARAMDYQASFEGINGIALDIIDTSPEQLNSAVSFDFDDIFIGAEGGQDVILGRGEDYARAVTAGDKNKAGFNDRDSQAVNDAFKDTLDLSDSDFEGARIDMSEGETSVDDIADLVEGTKTSGSFNGFEVFIGTDKADYLTAAFNGAQGVSFPSFSETNLEDFSYLQSWEAADGSVSEQEFTGTVIMAVRAPIL